ncbi:FAD-dependent oxidoreductase [bacterium]|nr:FAD-dependent oxidoreductase [bacterium]NBX81631.1 FAD-dependent oxidoreductase [bacterium]
MIDTDVVVIGGGVIGLSCVNQIPVGLKAILIEKNRRCGEESSSRNSEVIHSGIYYPHGSQKTEHCKVGRNELYRFCEKNQIPFKQCGKVVVATSQDEVQFLEGLAAHCEYEIVPFQRLSKNLIQRRIPWVQGVEALYFPLSGIFDVHQYLRCLEIKARSKEVTIATNSRVSRFLSRDPWILEVEEGDQKWQLRAKIVINAAGLEAATLSNEALQVDRYEHKLCRGRYLLINHLFSEPLSVLIYPVPEEEGLGLHLTPDLSGQVRLGPDTEWWSPQHKNKASKSLYDCDWDTLKKEFVAQSKKLLPSLSEQHLSPGFVGVRPKLYVEGKAYRDFLIERHERYIHLLGIESPGLTASLSIGAQVGRETEAIS